MKEFLKVWCAYFLEVRKEILHGTQRVRDVHISVTNNKAAQLNEVINSFGFKFFFQLDGKFFFYFNDVYLSNPNRFTKVYNLSHRMKSYE